MDKYTFKICEAAAHWSDIVMPNNYVEAERKAIEGPRG